MPVCAWLISLNIMISRSIHVATSNRVSSLLWLTVFHGVRVVHVLYSSTDGRVGYFHFLAIVTEHGSVDVSSKY